MVTVSDNNKDSSFEKLNGGRVSADMSILFFDELKKFLKSMLTITLEPKCEEALVIILRCFVKPVTQLVNTISALQKQSKILFKSRQ